MKKLLLVVAMVAAGFTANAQENVIKANPLALLGGTDLVSYERALGDNSSAILSAGIGGFKLGGVEYDSKGVGAQYRYYFDEALKGWYAGAGVDYQFGSVESGGTFSFDGGSATVEKSKTDFSAFGAGAKAGYQWVWESGFSLDLNIGAAYSSFSYENESQSEALGFKGSGILPTFGFGLGYAW